MTNYSNPLIHSIEQTFAECLEVVKKKNKDYAGDGDPFRNFKGSLHVGVSVERAILVRMMDKMGRISNLLDKEAEVTSESIGDSLHDLINYAGILKAYLKK